MTPAKKPTKTRKKPELAPVRFIPVERAFEPQIRVRATRSMSGWVDRGKKSGKRVKWHIDAGALGMIDESAAREFQVKGFVEILDGEVKPVSEDEAAEFLSQTTTIGL